MLLRLLAVSFAFATALAAQSLVPMPASHAFVEGTSSTNVPFGRSTPTRVQYVYDAMLFAGPSTITALQFRLDGGAAAASKVVDCEIRMSTFAVSLVAVSADFAANRGADETVVLPRQLLTLPAQPFTGTPSAFLPSIPLAVPFAHNPLNGGLLIEIIVFAQPPGAYSLDVTYVCSSPESGIGPQSCPQTGGLPLRVESATTQVIWGRPWVARVLDTPANALVILVVGTVESGPWGGFNLPQDLAGIGATSCFLSIDIAASWVSIAAADGTTVFPFVLANSPATIGDWIRFQAIAFDASANALGLVTSQARKVQVCGWEPVARVWSSGITATLGTREIGLGAVLQLSTQ